MRRPHLPELSESDKVALRAYVRDWTRAGQNVDTDQCGIGLAADTSFSPDDFPRFPLVITLVE